MEFSVSPHNAFYDEKYLYIILIMLVLASIVCFACFFLVKDKKPVEAPKAELEKAPDQVELRRKETLSKLEALDAKYKKKEINVRETSMIISATVREFLAFATGKEIDCSTLSEMHKWNSEDLTKLIECLYGAEFSKYSAKDAANFLRDAKRLVAAWR